MRRTVYKFAIVGVGPRGGYALERLVKVLSERKRPCSATIALFDPSERPGSGPIYTNDQPASNWINITERVLLLDQRPELQLGSTTVPEFPSFHQWADLVFNEWPDDRVDTYPPRSTVGRYLNERFMSLVEPLIDAGIVEFTSARVDQLTYREGVCRVVTDTGESHVFDDVLLTVGHQPTRRDEQMTEWSELIERHSSLTLHEDPYPVSRLLPAADELREYRVAIRGYGLAMIDIARALAEHFGAFQITDDHTRAQTYTLGKRHLRIAPFSRDGLAPGPKPLTPRLDKQFAPTPEEIERLETNLRDEIAQAAATGEQFLIDAMTPVIARRVKSAGPKAAHAPGSLRDIETVVDSWLKNPEFCHDCILSRDTSPADTLRTYVAMATGAGELYLDYFAGQVWRHCQPTIYASLSHSALPNEVLAKIVGLDERLKRYAFGPPVESIQQLIALHDAGVLNLDLLNDPDIKIDAQGWTLTEGRDTFTAPTMINSVLDSPAIAQVISPLISSLLDADLIKAAHDDLGVVTDEAGYVRSAGETTLPIAMLGRLAKGTVIGVDAILECFGDRPDTWARAAVDRMQRARI